MTEQTEAASDSESATGQGVTLTAVAGLIRAALMEERSVTERANALAVTLGLGDDDSADAIEAGLKSSTAAAFTAWLDGKGMFPARYPDGSHFPRRVWDVRALIKEFAAPETDAAVPMVIVAPRPDEVAVARVPAGSAFRVPLRSGQHRDLAGCGLPRWIEVPGQALGFWGADWTERYSAHRAGGAHREIDRAVWQQAARLLDGDPVAPAVVYVLIEETIPDQPDLEGDADTRPAWRAVSVRQEAPDA